MIKAYILLFFWIQMHLCPEEIQSISATALYEQAQLFLNQTHLKVS